MKNTVEMTSGMLRAMFSEEIVRLCEQKNDIRKLLEEKYEITAVGHVQTYAESLVQHAMNSYKGDGMTQFRAFVADLVDNKDSVSKLENSEDKAFMEHFYEHRFRFLAGVAEYALAIIDCEIEFREKSGLGAVIEAVRKMCAYADSNKCWSEWNQNMVRKSVGEIAANYAYNLRTVCRYTRFPLLQGVLAA